MLTWQLVVMFLSLGVAVATIVVTVVMNRRSARNVVVNEHQLSNRISVLESELSAMMDGAFGVASHLEKVEVHLKDTVQRQEQLQQRDMGNLPYNDAVRLAGKGANVDALVEHCSRSRSEAELVARLHKKSIPVSADSVDSNDDYLSHQKMTSQRIEQPTDEQLNTAEQSIGKVMAEPLSPLQAEPVHSANNVVDDDCTAIQFTETALDIAGEISTFDETLACSQDFNSRHNSLNEPDASEETSHTPEGPHGSDERD